MNDRRPLKGSKAILVTAPAPLGARRGALVLVIALFVAFCVLTPFTLPIPRVEAFIPVFDPTLALINLLTDGLLLVAFSRS